MEALFMVFLLLAAVCFLVAAFGTPVTTRVNFVAAGLFLWVLVPLLKAIQALD